MVYGMISERTNRVTAKCCGNDNTELQENANKNIHEETASKTLIRVQINVILNGNMTNGD